MDTSIFKAIVDVVREFGIDGIFIIFICLWVWWFIREKSAFKASDDISRILAQYKDDVSEVKRLYENNVRLVEDFSKVYQRLEDLYNEAIGIISLNTQTQTRLADRIMTNMYCPLIRKDVPHI